MKAMFRHASHAGPVDPAKDRIKMAHLQLSNLSAMASLALGPDIDDVSRCSMLETVLMQASQLSATLAEVEADMDSKERKATTDVLTGIYNRTYFDPALDTAITAVHATRMPMTLMAFDIDHFKSVNDTYGHAAGDRVLKIFAQQLRKGVKEKDIVARIGGEEFMIIFPDTTRMQAVRIANRLRQAVASRPAEPGAPAVTVSVGVAMYNNGDTPEILMKRADAALYRAKHNGRNRVECAPATVRKGNSVYGSPRV